MACGWFMLTSRPFVWCVRWCTISDHTFVILYGFWIKHVYIVYDIRAYIYINRNRRKRFIVLFLFYENKIPQQCVRIRLIAISAEIFDSIINNMLLHVNGFCFAICQYSRKTYSPPPPIPVSGGEYINIYSRRYVIII